jgi:hypothetical protein
MLRFCIAHCYLPKSWSIAITFLTSAIVDVEAGLNINVKHFNATVVPQVLLMVSLVSAVTLEMQPHSFWTLLITHVLNILISSMDKFPISSVTDDLQRATVQLLCFGLFQPITAVFPFAPNSTDGEEVIDFALQPGQPSPPRSPLPTPVQPLEQTVADAQLAEAVRDLLVATLPERIKLLPWIYAAGGLDCSDLHLYAKAVEANRDEQFVDWMSFTSSIRALFGSTVTEMNLQTVLDSQQFSQVVEFVAGLLVRFVDSPVFPSLLSSLLLGNSSTAPSLSLTSMLRVTIRVLESLNTKKIFSASFLQFVCDRVREGWFARTLTIIDLMLAMCDNCSRLLPESVANLLIDGFSIIVDDDCPTFLGLFVTYAQQVFSVEKFEFYILLLDRLLAKYERRPRIVSAILAAFCEAFRANEDFSNKWEKSVISSCRDCHLAILFDGLSILSERGLPAYTQWLASNQLFEIDFLKARTKEQLIFERARRSELLSLYARLATDRTREAMSFVTFTNQVLNGLHNNITIARAVCACIRQFHTERLLLSLNYFMRQREALITGSYRFAVNQSSRKAITILGDPLYPSRRIENSPLLYNLPSFPGGKTDSVLLPMPEIPELLPLLPPIIQDLSGTPFCQFEDFALRTPRQLKLCFSQILPLSDRMQLSILELVLNDGKKFEQLCECAFLYGVEPLPGLLLKSQSHLFYIEGMKLTDDGVSFTHTTTARALYTFYMSYFISGHFGISQLFGAHPIVRWPINELLYCCQRYWLHKPVAVELNFVSGWRFILIPTVSEFRPFLAMVRKFVDDSLSRLPRSPTGASPIASAHLLRRRDPTKLWTDGLVDNFTYLCLINRSGRRSLADYTQYYVFPWIIGDYNTTQLESAPQESFRNLSLPMGQIGRERGPRFDTIFEDSGNRYFYGTHYMHLGVVLFFLFRIDPFCLFSVYLHRGWDHQNRLFYNVYESWMAAAYTSPADVKELIPEFFCVPEFLENASGLPLTTTTDGRDVARVNTGHWTQNPHDFVCKMRKFLQADNITAGLPGWLDLIFGFKSRGEAAVAAKNVFHPLAYVQEDEEIESEDRIEREAAVTCVINFGQCPHQAIAGPHPPVARRFARPHLMADPTLLMHQPLNAGGVPRFVSGVRIKEGALEFAWGRAVLVPGGEVALERTRARTQKVTLFEGTWISSASAIGASADGAWLAVGQREGGVALWLLRYADGEVDGAREIGRFPTGRSVTACAVSSEHFLALALCGDQIVRIDLGTRRVAEPIRLHHAADCLAVDEQAGTVVTGGPAVAVWSLGGRAIAQAPVEAAAICVEVADIEEGIENRFFVTGHVNGAVRFWGINWAQMALVSLKQMRPAGGPIRAIGIGDASNRVVVVTESELFSFDYFGSPAVNLKREYAVECNNCQRPIDAGGLVQAVKICANCHRFFCQACLPSEICSHCVSVRKHTH